MVCGCGCMFDCMHASIFQLAKWINWKTLHSETLMLLTNFYFYFSGTIWFLCRRQWRLATHHTTHTFNQFLHYCPFSTNGNQNTIISQTMAPFSGTHTHAREREWKLNCTQLHIRKCKCTKKRRALFVCGFRVELFAFWGFCNGNS